jgi:hypothetical protein
MSVLPVPALALWLSPKSGTECIKAGESGTYFVEAEKKHEACPEGATDRI